MSRKVLIVDDEAAIRQSLEGALMDEGFRVKLAETGEKALEQIRREIPDVVMLDIWMPGRDGLQILSEIKALWPDLPVVMMSGHGTIETAVKSTKLGAYDFIEKPIELDRTLVVLRNAMSAGEMQIENQALRKQLSERRTLIGESQPINQIRDLVRRVAPTSSSVLITGENGTGKEVVAKMVHALSPRFKKPFIEVNCAAIPEELIESELFGHERGAFTGAVSMRKGRFDLADGGTIFLDEIGDMSLKTQAKVLRILQEQRFERVGGADTHSVDVRVIAATNKDLKGEIQEGNFREDLFYRLNVIPIQIPPLRDRGKDLLMLADYFLDEFSLTHQKPRRKFSDDAYKILQSYNWPGNVRELRNFIERIVILQLPTDENSRELSSIQAAELYSHLQISGDTNLDSSSTNSAATDDSGPARNLKDARSEFEREFIIKALKENNWNVSKTASILGIERSYLHRRMKAFGIDEDSK